MRRYIRRLLTAHWPHFYEIIAGTLALSGVAIVFASWQQWWGIIPLVFVALLGVVYFYLAATNYVANLAIAEHTLQIIWDAAQLKPTAEFVAVTTGLRQTAVGLARQLTFGHMTVIDIYNPQLIVDPAIARLRALALDHARRTQSDPRVQWMDAQIGLLPMRDEAVDVVICDQVLSLMINPPDREQLLGEMMRVLKPGGRLLALERIERPENTWLRGIVSTHSWLTGDEMRRILHVSGYDMRQDRELNTVLMLFRADKPIAPPGQLRLDLTF